MSDYITTFSKVHFTPLKPKKEQIRIEDIAHSLSLMTRANGHFPEFYSVGQHCIHCYEEAKARELPKRLVLACLLHDASEAYLADITRPVKKNLPKYLVIEKILQDAIYERFLGSVLTEEEKKIVSEIDDALLYYEFYHYMGEKLQDSEPRIVSNPDFSVVPFAEVEKKYIEFSQI
ncbi:MAG: phosphohydrolase [Lachnospiraceae bacterium]|nr:phosphohydrolase [Lachnospiraceae bacterium]